MAIAERQPGPGVIHHSDQGVQYASGEYTDELKSHGFEISTARTGDPYENAVMESFFKTLKYEEVYLCEYETFTDVLARLPYPAPADVASCRLLKEQIDEVLSTLSPGKQRVLQLRFGLEDGRTRTPDEVGKEFGVTRKRIRQIEAKALRKLRHPSHRLKDYLE